MVLPSSVMARPNLIEGAEIAARLQAAEAGRAGRTPAPARSLDIQRLRAGAKAPSDGELSDLARRADALQTDPVAGGTKKTLLIIGAVVVVAVLLAAAIVESCKEQGAECLD